MKVKQVGAFRELPHGDKASGLTLRECISTPHEADGTWAWYGDLAYYVEKYHVRLPNEFIEHMKMNNWMVSPEDTVDIDNLQWCENPTT